MDIGQVVSMAKQVSESFNLHSSNQKLAPLSLQNPSDNIFSSTAAS